MLRYGQVGVDGVWREKEPEKENMKNETRLKQVLKPKEYEKMKGVIEKLISDKEITIQDVMKITGKSRTTAWRYMQKFIRI